MALLVAAPETTAPTGTLSELQRLGAKVRPPNLAGGRLLPVTAGLREILPAGGLQRGATVVIDAVRAAGATTLAFELLAGPSVGGYWCAVAGGVELGLVAAAERGIDLARLLLVPSLGPPDRWLQVVATLFDSVDVVLFIPRVAVRQSDARRLVARSRERESVFLVLDHRGHWQGPSDLRCTVTRSEWSGLGRGHGLLTARRYELEVSGRGAAARPRHAPLQLPA
ncbi:MAG: hypothetical protein ABSD78_12105 [Acidimicrobiales bacterium]|jgi:hypothetical protein